MASATTGGGATPKIKALQSAVKNFVDMWDSLRQQEIDAGTTNADKIGVALFDSTPNWWGDAAVGLAPGLNNIDAGNNPNVNIVNFLNPASCTATSCGQLVPGTSTSIGAGLVLATKAFPNDGNRHVVLLMTDGLQNTDPKVEASTNGASVYCDAPTSILCTNSVAPQSCTLVAPCPLSLFAAAGSQPATIYSVTVGLGPGVSDGSVIQPIAANSGGFFMNTETNSALLSPMFLEVLQNFLKFFSYETVRIISEPTPYSANVPISSTSQNVAFSVMWPSQAALRLTVTPPGGAKPIVKESASGFISIVQLLPLPAPFDPKGDWKVLVEALNAPGTPNTGGVPAPVNTGSSVQFDLHVMTDDGGIKTDLAVVPADYKPGDQIKLRAKLTRFGLPIVGLRSHPGDIMKADLIEPGQSVGDILSDSTASANPPPSQPDMRPGAEAKLFNTLQNDPSALQHTSRTVQLFDDGKAEHGDDVAGDGIYSALYPATVPGHYNFLFSVESTAADAVRFSRQQLRTVYVRALPDAGQTALQSSLQPCPAGVTLPSPTTPAGAGRGCSTLVITMKPRTKFGNRMGPGWANYFWFTAPGVAPFKAHDNLDGTYTATLNFAGNQPPGVLVHFENVIAVIDDSVPPEQLPDPLGNSNVLAAVPPPGGAGKLAAFLDLGGNFPNGMFATAFNNGFSMNAGLEYMVTAHFSAEAIFGYHHFPGQTIVNPTILRPITTGDLNIYQFSGNAKVYLTPPQKVRPFVNGGIGGYTFSPGSSNFGGNVGGGVLFELNSRWGVQGSYNFHAVNTPVTATEFSALQGGIRVVF